MDSSFVDGSNVELKICCDINTGKDFDKIGMDKINKCTSSNKFKCRAEVHPERGTFPVTVYIKVTFGLLTYPEFGNYAHQNIQSTLSSLLKSVNSANKVVRIDKNIKYASSLQSQNDTTTPSQNVARRFLDPITEKNDTTTPSQNVARRFLDPITEKVRSALQKRKGWRREAGRRKRRENRRRRREKKRRRKKRKI